MFTGHYDNPANKGVGAVLYCVSSNPACHVLLWKKYHRSQSLLWSSQRPAVMVRKVNIITTDIAIQSRSLNKHCISVVWLLTCSQQIIISSITQIIYSGRCFRPWSPELYCSCHASTDKHYKHAWLIKNSRYPVKSMPMGLEPYHAHESFAFISSHHFVQKKIRVSIMKMIHQDRTRCIQVLWVDACMTWGLELWSYCSLHYYHNDMSMYPSFCSQGHKWKCCGLLAARQC